MFVSDFGNHVKEISYRFAKISAERKDVRIPIERDEDDGIPAKQEFQLSMDSNSEAIFAEVALTVDSKTFTLDVLVSGRWQLQDNAPDAEELRRDFGQMVAIPRLVAVAESQIASLARQIDVELPVFTFDIDNELNKRGLMQRGNE